MILKVSNVSKNYNQQKALDNVSIQLNGGSILGLLGPNGAGKTTLLRSITGITMIDKGEILLDGQPIQDEVRRMIGYLPEERGLYPEMYVGEQLIYLARLKGMSYEAAEASVTQWLRKFEISGTRHKKTNELSKGMQQKIQFIAAVIHQPKLLILDEPFSGFDPINAELIKQEILRLKSEGVGIILSTHNMTSVEEICDHIALINKARIVLMGETAEIRQQYNHNKIVLNGIPKKEITQGETSSTLFSKRDDNMWVVERKEGVEADNNALIRELMEYFSIVAIEEAHPSMNEIFLKAVENSL